MKLKEKRRFSAQIISLLCVDVMAVIDIGRFSYVLLKSKLTQNDEEVLLVMSAKLKEALVSC